MILVCTENVLFKTPFKVSPSLVTTPMLPRAATCQLKIAGVFTSHPHRSGRLRRCESFDFLGNLFKWHLLRWQVLLCPSHFLLLSTCYMHMMAGTTVTLLYHEAALGKAEKKDKRNTVNWQYHGLTILAWDCLPTDFYVRETIPLTHLTEHYFLSVISGQPKLLFQTDQKMHLSGDGRPCKIEF